MPRLKRGMTASNLATGDCRIKIIPIRIALFDQSDLPRPIPLFQPLLAFNRILGIVELLEVNEARDIVFFSEAFDQLRFVLCHPTNQIIGDADVERTADAACENVDVVAASTTFPGILDRPASRTMTPVASSA